jgi:hypothetical protein
MTNGTTPPLELADGRTVSLPVPSEFGGIPIQPVSELQPYLKMLLYGKPGAGKTRFAAEASFVPAMSPVLVMTPDASEADTLKAQAPDAIHAMINKFQDFWDIYGEAAKGIKDPNRIPFKTIIIDTGTEAQKLSMNNIMTDLVKKGRPGGGEVNPDVPSVREWGQSISEMRRVLRSFRDLPVNFIVNCHETSSRDNRGVSWYVPDLPGKLANQVAGMFSSVCYLYVSATTEREGNKNIIVSEQRRLLTGFVEGYVCKSRSGTLPRVMIDPWIGELYELVTGRTGGQRHRPTENGTTETENGPTVLETE